MGIISKGVKYEFLRCLYESDSGLRTIQANADQEKIVIPAKAGMTWCSAIS
jgi:hypothetical protein